VAAAGAALPMLWRWRPEKKMPMVTPPAMPMPVQRRLILALVWVLVLRQVLLLLLLPPLPLLPPRASSVCSTETQHKPACVMHRAAQGASHTTAAHAQHARHNTHTTHFHHSATRTFGSVSWAWLPRTQSTPHCLARWCNTTRVGSVTAWPLLQLRRGTSTAG